MSNPAATSAATRKTLVVFGGTGYVGRRVITHALNKGYEVTSISRSGRAPYEFPNAHKVQWIACDVSNRRAVDEALAKVDGGKIDGVVSAIGLLTLNRNAAIQMNGSCNVNIVNALFNKKRIEEEEEEGKAPKTTQEQGGDVDLPRFAYVSAANFGWPAGSILRAYYDGKVSTERAMMEHCKGRGVILRPGAIYGTRHTAANVPIPLTPFFWPMEIVFAPLFRITGIKFLQPPVNVDVVARAALEGAMTDSAQTDSQLKALKVNPEYKVSSDSPIPIFDHDGIVSLASKFGK